MADPLVKSTSSTRVAPASPGQVKPTAPTATSGPTGIQPAKPTDHTQDLFKLPKDNIWTGQCLCSKRTLCLSCYWFELIWVDCVWCYNHDQFSYSKSHLMMVFSKSLRALYPNVISTGIILCFLKKRWIWLPGFTLMLFLWLSLFLVDFCPLRVPKIRHHKLSEDKRTSNKKQS